MYPNLRAEMARIGLVNRDIAETLSVTMKSVRNKLDKKTPLTVPEAIKIRNKHFPKLKLDYLFADESEERQVS